MEERIHVGDKVKIINDTKYWNDTLAVVKSIDFSDPDGLTHELELLSDTPIGHYKAGMNVGRWSQDNLIRFPSDRDKLEASIEASFPARIDVYFSALTGGAVVLDRDGNLHRILADGTVDTTA